MKTSITVSTLVALALTGIVCAKSAAKKNPEVKLAIAGSIVDKDKDKQLSAEELNKLKENYEENRAKAQAKMLEKYDTNKDGQIDDSEKEAKKEAAAARKEKRKAKMLEKFDTDKNGELSADEKKAMREAMQDKRKGPRKPRISPGRLADENKDSQLDDAELTNFANNYAQVADKLPERPANAKKGKRGGKGKKRNASDSNTTTSI